MCGFVGFYNNNYSSLLRIEDLQRMNELIIHRGPNSEGIYGDKYVGLGFRRLSILDVSEAGTQPMTDLTGQYTIIFNGEIYNYVELREQLESEGVIFQTHTDTEVILNLYKKEKENVVNFLRGMFGFVIYDKENNSIFGARDFFGIKPFFYYENEIALFFASEKKSLLSVLSTKELDSVALQHYLTFQYVPEPFSLHDGIKKLLPGHCFTKKTGEKIQIKNYWKPSFTPINMKKSKRIEEIQHVLRDSVKVHMRSDVPVGSFLSGGIDSSIVVSLAKEHNPNLLTFSVGFEHSGYSEIDVAKKTAAALGIQNIDVTITPEMYVDALPQIMWHMDDPLADPACVPLYFVAKEASKHVTVVLSGEGADELFGGYNIYREPSSLQIFNYLPFHKWINRLSKILPEGMKGKSFIERGTTPLTERYVGNAKMFLEDEKKQLLKTYSSNHSYLDVTNPYYGHVKQYDDETKMQYIDMNTWLRGDILLKADKMTMAHSLELRVPFLDKEVFNVASKITTEEKFANNTTKSILREAVKGIVPDHVLTRKKLGFPVPIRHWLRNELYDWAKETITTSQTECYINKNYVLALLEKHRTGSIDYSRKIWTVLMFMVWHGVYVEEKYAIHVLIEKSVVLV